MRAPPTLAKFALFALLAAPAPGQEESYAADRTLRFHFSVGDGAEDWEASEARVVLEYSSDEGSHWREATSVPARQGSVDWTVPEDGRYLFRVIALDAVGNRETEDVAERAVVVDTRSPTVEILSPTAEHRHKAASDMTILWRVQDAHLGERPVQVRYALNNEATLHPLGEAFPAEMREPPARLFIPSDAWSVRVVVTATDRAGNEGTVQFYVGQEFIYPAVMDPARVVGLPEATMARRLEVPYGVDPRYETGLERVELFVSTDAGRTWEPTGLVDGAVGRRLGRFDWTAPRDGVYGFRLLAFYERGFTATPTPGAEMEPQGTVLVDSVPPRVELESPVGGALVWRGGERYPLVWLAGDNVQNLPLEFHLEYSLEGGSEGSWRDLKLPPGAVARESDRATLPAWSEALVPDRYRIPWVLPYFSSEDFRLRVRVRDFAGNEGTAASGRIQVRAGAPPVVAEATAGAPPETAEDTALLEARWHLARGNRRGYLDAMALYDVILETRPDHLDALMDRGHARFQLARLGEALADFQRAASLAPRDPLPVLNEAACYLAMGNKSKTAVRLYRERLMDDMAMNRSLSDDQASELARGLLEAARQIAWKDRPPAEQEKVSPSDLLEAERTLAAALELERLDPRLEPPIRALREELLVRLKGTP
ncbi:MAG: hypothetical protein HY722_07795 [Planctomycetes bacterium]|nr:hypothetical protein [Planctomycetota bacterium]